MITLDSKVEAVLGEAGAKRKRIVEGLHIETVGDLLNHHPRRYVKTAELTEVESLVEGEMLVVVGKVSQSRERTYTDRRTGRPAYRVEVTLATGGPDLRMTFFAKNARVSQYHQHRLQPGRRGIFQGKASRFNGQWQLTNPQMVLMGTPGEDTAQLALENLGDLYPIYPLTKGVESWDLQRAVAFALSVLEELPDPIPEDVREEHGLIGLRQALAWLHAPDDFGQVTRARKRLAFDEALVSQLVLGRRRRAAAAEGARPRTGGGGLLAAFDARLPFTLTAGQERVGEEIFDDLARDRPMNRLLQGEVGSGKTLVALRAMLRVVDSGGQAALLAPTEVLAQQHHRSLTAMLGDLAAGGMLGGADEATRVELLTGSMTKRERTEPLLRLASGEAGIVVGTHALLQDTVQLADLGLVVVDEQHRFGVEQRAALTDKSRGVPPHVLVMTATPIPRTVAMTVFGDLETSVLDELPAGRAPIQSTVVPLADAPHWADRIWARAREEVGKGHQVYVVCPRISGDEEEPADALDASDSRDDWGDPTEGAAGGGEDAPRPLSAVEDVVAELSSGPLAGLRVQPLHGRMAADEKDRTMRSFAAGDVDVLVSTTVIEVGVDVANATTMVLLDADRFGISQLHQLRGRVGRGGLPGLCLLVTHAEAGSPARERLDAVAGTSDGFELSRIDLELRREGDVLGASQSGLRSSLQTLRVLRDEETIVAAREAATALLDADADLRQAPLLAGMVTELERTAAAAFVDRS
ncbi:ATP-dependent DNA helicase RecG [Nocardioides bruguierae]|uniref:Probable DNA 3'-5' helicase RecG n=1 Tax=Nocardioides bruguierae TaxID=2945102 RepID=A0A9X2IDE6_9ACTN|nr:ATP-dependent DNA helicase RecG [Nocardioides bruguierae]MCM0619671.1 ATP-dependent DNA helicase RecG [Nocardioides bruguierae]